MLWPWLFDEEKLHFLVVAYKHTSAVLVFSEESEVNTTRVYVLGFFTLFFLSGKCECPLCLSYWYNYNHHTVAILSYTHSCISPFTHKRKKTFHNQTRPFLWYCCCFSLTKNWKWAQSKLEHWHKKSSQPSILAVLLLSPSFFSEDKR